VSRLSLEVSHGRELKNINNFIVQKKICLFSRHCSVFWWNNYCFRYFFLSICITLS